MRTLACLAVAALTAFAAAAAPAVEAGLEDRLRTLEAGVAAASARISELERENATLLRQLAPAPSDRRAIPVPVYFDDRTYLGVGSLYLQPRTTETGSMTFTGQMVLPADLRSQFTVRITNLVERVEPQHVTIQHHYPSPVYYPVLYAWPLVLTNTGNASPLPHSKRSASFRTPPPLPRAGVGGRNEYRDSLPRAGIDY